MVLQTGMAGRQLLVLLYTLQVLMATNRIDILDSALLRPGRIDRKIEFPNPPESARVDILKIHSRKMNLTRGIDHKKIADKMSGASGAELKACCTEAGMFALRERRVHVTQEDFEMAVAKVRPWKFCAVVPGTKEGLALMCVGWHAGSLQLTGRHAFGWPAIPCRLQLKPESVMPVLQCFPTEHVGGCEHHCMAAFVCCWFTSH